MSRQTLEALLLGVIIEQIEPRVKALVAYHEEHAEASFVALEQEAWRLSHGSWVSAVTKLLEQRRGEVELAYHCPHCGGRPVNKGLQKRTQETLLGVVRWRRSYYYCRPCGKGYYPLDEAWGIAAGQFSEGVQQKVARLAARMPFVPAAEEFECLTGGSVSGREVERLAEERGEALEAHLTQEAQQVCQQGAQPSSYPEQSSPEDAWGVALDAGKVHLLDAWHDVDVGVVFRPGMHENQEGEMEVSCKSPSYVAKITSMEETGRRVYLEGCKRGLEASQKPVVCLGDGAPGNWKQFATHFPQRVEILDWYHAVEHLWKVGHALYDRAGSTAVTAWVQAQEKALWEGRAYAVLNGLRALAEEPTGQAAAEEVHYFLTNQARMDYARYRAEGYPIGSGSAESGCKQLVGARLKQAGMRWSKTGAQAILNLRAALLSKHWDEAWKWTSPSPCPT